MLMSLAIFKNKFQSGSSLVESILSVGILMIALVGPLALVQRGFTTSAENITETVALYLAQDALEFIKNINDTNRRAGNPWLQGLDMCVSDTCRVDTVFSQPLATAVQTCSGTECILKYDDTENQYGYQVGVNSIFTRYFSITSVVLDEEARVTVTVSWESGATAESVALFGHLFNPESISTLGYGLIAHWAFDNTVDDSSGNGHNGALIGSPTYVTGKIGQGLSFDDGTDAVSVPDSNDWDFAGKSRTVSFWMKVASGYDHTDFGMILDHFTGGAPGDGWSTYIHSSSEKIVVNARADSDGIYAVTNAATNDGIWHMYSITLNGSTARVYVDASFESEDPYTNLRDYDQALFIGNNQSGTDDLNASLDDIRIYNRVLSDGEIDELYQLGG
jgi:Tfp pilus assembly protein PilV